MPHLIQLLLPLHDNEGRSFPPGMHGQVKQELKDKFGGVTAYNRSTAEGQWKAGERDFSDEIVVYEVMAPEADPEWWRAYRQELESRFLQEEVVVRVLTIQRF